MANGISILNKSKVVESRLRNCVEKIKLDNTQLMILLILGYPYFFELPHIFFFIEIIICDNLIEPHNLIISGSILH
jgi:hypothetical protein